MLKWRIKAVLIFASHIAYLHIYIVANHNYKYCYVPGEHTYLQIIFTLMIMHLNNSGECLEFSNEVYT